ncbi:MAG: M48 family metallopeptidase [Cyanobacteria bacterium J06632_3]
MKYVPKEITQEVNTTPVHPLVNLGYLLGTVALAGAVIYAGLGLVADQIVRRVGPTTEEKIGAVLVHALPFETVDSDSRVEYLTELALSLQADSAQTAAGAAQYPPVKVQILDTPLENAMVTAGSYLYVTEGLLAAVESENELAFVMSHELGHLHHRDPLTALGRSVVWITISGLLGIGQQMPSIAPNMWNLAELGHSREQERAADDYAIALIHTRYGHGAHSLSFFQRVQADEVDLGALNRVAEWQHTHPLTRDRIENIEDTFKANGWELSGDITPLPKNFGCRNFEPCGG